MNYWIRCAISTSVALIAEILLTHPMAAADKVVDELDVPAGAISDVLSPDAIETTPRDNPATDPEKVTIQEGGDSIFWARTRITLKDGFRATGGSYNGYPTGFLAAIDSDLDGYSDVEEATDSDGDGIFDAWELHNGLNMYDPADAALDYDSDGVTNLAEFQSERDPLDPSDGGMMPAGFNLVLQTPTEGSYLGVKTTSWVISTINGP